MASEQYHTPIIPEDEAQFWDRLQDSYAAERDRRIEAMGSWRLARNAEKLSSALKDLQLEVAMQGLSNEAYTKAATAGLIFSHCSQYGLTCVSFSLANALHFKGEQFFRTNREHPLVTARTTNNPNPQAYEEFVEALLTHTASESEHSQMRYLEQAQKFLSSAVCRNFLDESYKLVFRPSLVQVVGDIYQNSPVLAITEGHCVLAYSIERRSTSRAELNNPDNYFVMVADPLNPDNKEMALPEFHREYAHAPLYDVLEKLSENSGNSGQYKGRVRVTKNKPFDKTPAGILGHIRKIESADMGGIGIRAASLVRIRQPRIV